MDGNVKIRNRFFSYMKPRYNLFFYIPVLWIPAIPAGMTKIQFA